MYLARACFPSYEASEKLRNRNRMVRIYDTRHGWYRREQGFLVWASSRGLCSITDRLWLRALGRHRRAWTCRQGERVALSLLPETGTGWLATPPFNGIAVSKRRPALEQRRFGGGDVSNPLNQRYISRVWMSRRGRGKQHAPIAAGHRPFPPKPTGYREDSAMSAGQGICSPG